MSQKSEALTDLFGSLTEVQREAAEWTDGPMLLLAGPGSGKTRVLTARIARLLSESADKKWRIAALTFTTRAADEMRSRVLALAPNQDSRLFIGTFHSFACELLRQSGSLMGIKTDFQIYSTTEDRSLLLARAMAEAGIRVEWSIDKILPVLDRLRERLVLPEETGRHFSNPAEGSLVQAIYQAYSAFMLKENAQDFTSLIFNAFLLLKNFPAVANKFRTTYKYLCIDEFQDTNAAQYSLTRIFTGTDYRNVFVVADDDQIIYQWNGASHQRLSEYIRDYAPVSLQMPTNFRCPSNVVNLANNLVSHNKLRTAGKKPLLAGKVAPLTDDTIRIAEFPTDVEEADGIARDISNMHKEHLGTVAVIARTKALLEQAKSALSKQGITAKIAQRRDAFASVPYSWLQSCLKISNRRYDERVFATFSEVSNSLFGFDLDADEIIADARSSSHRDLLRTWASFASAAEPGAEFCRKLIDVTRSELAERQDYRLFIKSALSIYGENEAQLVDDHASFGDDKRAWRELAREINATIGIDAGLDAFLQELEMRSKEPPLGPTDVSLLTIHGSKGNEFDHVYLIGLAEDILPSFQSKKRGDESPEMEEERRNCFVAITRCMSTLTLSFAHQYGTWRRQRSRFLAEMGL